MPYIWSGDGKVIELRRRRTEHSSEQQVYDSIYQQEPDAIEQWTGYYRWILNLLNPAPGSRLLDVSCGTNVLVSLARQRGVSAVGVDFSLAALRRRREPGAVANGELLPFGDSSFDWVVNLGSLEHFEDMTQGVREMQRVLGPSGVCCILVPNTFGLFWTVWHAARTGEVYEDEQPIQRYATLKQWQRLLEANGLQVFRVVPYETAPAENWEQWRYYLRHPKSILLPKVLLRRWVPLPLASMFVFLSRKAQ